MQANMYNGMSLAYIGDAVYEVYIRKYALAQGLTKVNDLHKFVIEFTSSESQAKSIYKLLNDDVLTDDEILIYKRGRNSHVHSVRKNVDIKTYLDATGFEAIIGYLYLVGNIKRLEDLIAKVLDIS